MYIKCNVHLYTSKLIENPVQYVSTVKRHPVGVAVCLCTVRVYGPPHS